MIAQPASQTGEVSCLVVPCGRLPVLLPNVCVAEILPWRRIRKDDALPEWCLGTLTWRGEDVPVIDFDTLAGTGVVGPMGRFQVVVNRTRHAEGRPFYALAAGGLPRLVQVASGELHTLARPASPMQALHVQVGSEAAVIPDVGSIEDAVSALRV